MSLRSVRSSLSHNSAEDMAGATTATTWADMALTWVMAGMGEAMAQAAAGTKDAMGVEHASPPLVDTSTEKGG